MDRHRIDATNGFYTDRHPWPPSFGGNFNFFRNGALFLPPAARWISPIGRSVLLEFPPTMVTIRSDPRVRVPFPWSVVHVDGLEQRSHWYFRNEPISSVESVLFSSAVASHQIGGDRLNDAILKVRHELQNGFSPHVIHWYLDTDVWSAMDLAQSLEMDLNEVSTVAELTMGIANGEAVPLPETVSEYVLSVSRQQVIPW